MHPLRTAGRFFRALARIRHRPRDVFKAVLILAIGAPILVGGAAAGAFFVFPVPAIVPEPTAGSQAQTSQVFAADGSLIATFHSERNRELIKLSDMPVHLQQATIASEDARFYEHKGVDIKAIGRALVADVKAGETVQGGSTITQQYVKNTYIDAPKRTVFRKAREALIASQIERTFSKSKILENYLNTVYFGRGAYGVEAAAKTYFNKRAAEMSLSESALLVGVIPAPERFSPQEDPAAAEIRRTFVIDRMVKVGMIDQPTADAAKAQKPVIVPAQQQVFKYPYFVDALYRSMKNDPRYGTAKIFAGGLNIYTTIDPVMQAEAEKAVFSTLNKQTDPASSLVSIDPRTGYVKALVGGRDFEQSKFNLAVQIKRQAGSSMKPFVLVAALEKGIKPTTTYSAPGQMCPKGWPKDGCPVRNYGNSGYGSITVEKATINSVNTAYAQMIVAVTPKKVVEVAQRMGIKSKIRPFHAMGLGSEGVNPMEMASAYATLAANGVYREPKLVTKVTDSSGTVLESGPSEPHQVIDPNIAAKVSEILGKVITSGTGTKAKIGRPAAGKTGTADEFRNAWFCGYTPDLATAVWMGYPQNEKKPMLNIHGVPRVAGGTLPTKIWADFMKAALKDIPPSEFPKPGQIKIKDGEIDGLRLPPRMGPRPSPQPSPSIIEESPEPEPSPSPSPTPSEAPTTVPSVLP